MHSSKHLLQKMKEKGWSEEELEHARLIFLQNRHKHSIFHPKYDFFMHWALFGIFLICNLVVFLKMLPLIIILNNPISYFFLAMLGFGLGAIFDLVVSDLNHLEKHHHFFISLIIPVMTIFLFIVSMYIIQQNYPFLSTLIIHPLSLSLTYAVCFMLPYYFRQIRS